MRLMVGKNNVPVELFNNYKINEVSIPVQGLSKDVQCRLHETDPEVFNQIFIREEYKSALLPEDAKVIIDAGANVGYSVLYFKRRYPAATIIAIEPDPENYKMLCRNCGHLEGVFLLNAALWSRCEKLELKSTGEAGAALGSWGVRTVSISGEDKATLTDAYDVPALLDKFGVDSVDICKIDVEGAEGEIFREAHQAWFDRVRLFILETHERFAPGSDAAVKAALNAGLWEYARKAENQFFRRK